MMDELPIVTRLREYRPTNEWGEGVHHVICTEAADLISELSEALRGYLEAEEIDDPAIRLEELAASRKIARAALAKAAQ